MKTKISLFTIFVCSWSVLLAQSEDNAIKKMIESESHAYHENPDRAAFANYWSNEKGSIMVYSGAGNCVAISGEQIQTAAKSDNISKPDNAKVEMSNYVIRTKGNIAWAIFDQKTTLPNGKITYQHEFRCLEKIGEDWKIMGSSVHAYEPK